MGHGRRQRWSDQVACLPPVSQLQIALQEGSQPESMQPVHPGPGQMLPSSLAAGPAGCEYDGESKQCRLSNPRDGLHYAGHGSKHGRHYQLNNTA